MFRFFKSSSSAGKKILESTFWLGALGGVTYLTVKNEGSRIAKLKQEFPGATVNVKPQYLAGMGSYIEYKVEMPTAQKDEAPKPSPR